MMKYYVIRVSLNKKDIGTYPQVVHAKHNCHVWDNPKFVDKVNFQKINYEPITSNAILEKKAKLTDLISSNGVGFTLKLLISDKLKNIIEVYANKKCQFFKAPVIFKDDFVYGYYLLHPYNFAYENVNFEGSSFILRKKKNGGGNQDEKVNVSTFEDFQKVLSNKKKEGYQKFCIDRIKLKPDINEDFFVLRYVEGGIKYIVSEKLKKEIENLECTGIEFMPIEMKLTEWLQGGEREKVYGKA